MKTLIPMVPGFYLESGKSCSFADSKQISPKKYKLQHDLYYRALDNTLYKVCAGFIHDGASKGILKHFGRYTNAAILHDALYSINYNRYKADKLFLEAMKLSNVGWLRRYTYWLAVRSAGWIPFNWSTPEYITNCQKFVKVYGGK